MTDRLDAAYWKRIFQNHVFSPAPFHNPVVLWLLKHLPPGTGTCLEIGCYPGRFLPFLGSLGYTLHGIDFIDGVDTDLPEWLRSKGIKTGDFLKEDFFLWEPEHRYDVVCSFGFIEHFENWEEVIKDQAALVKPNGFLVVTAPNYRSPLQFLLQWTMNHRSLKTHNLKSMRPGRWNHILKTMSFDVQFSGYFGPFLFWNENKDRPGYQRWGLKVLDKLDFLLSRLPENNRLFSPCCGVIAKNTSRNQSALGKESDE